MSTLPLGRRVRIERDTASILWVLKCATPCGGNRGCVMDACWLGSAMTERDATRYAEKLGYLVVRR